MTYQSNGWRWWQQWAPKPLHRPCRTASHTPWHNALKWSFHPQVLLQLQRVYGSVHQSWDYDSSTSSNLQLGVWKVRTLDDDRFLLSNSHQLWPLPGTSVYAWIAKRTSVYAWIAKRGVSVEHMKLNNKTAGNIDIFKDLSESLKWHPRNECSPSAS